MNLNVRVDAKKIQQAILFSLVIASITIILNLDGGFTVSNAYAQETNTTTVSTPMSIQGNESNNISSITENIGQPFYVENTKSTNMRVLNVENVPTVEVTYIGNSTINGSPTQTIGTIIDKMGSDGAVHSKGQAIILTATGQVITYKSESIGYYNPDGSFSDSGIMEFGLPFGGSNGSNSTLQDAGSADKSYSEFKNVLGIYKKTVDPLGNGITKVWKWG
ncbi:hypothetical protein [Candidatus Nitrosocosmicus franklandus]|uniref:Uncharacterized protein n=1 Tax=Candidatus Nitrosocosmicus franklandianus TaxID=1798806 RepID=A0A484I6X4_9ARCH|nr:hypothetical protein [Candidatus Nitrosocosmicus franklandus]VFJ12931.1 conserved exported protein of unknown function [Candidatus Nitrosocosmicus franklandus]